MTNSVFCFLLIFLATFTASSLVGECFIDFFPPAFFIGCFMKIVSFLLALFFYPALLTFLIRFVSIFCVLSYFLTTIFVIYNNHYHIRIFPYPVISPYTSCQLFFVVNR